MNRKLIYILLAAALIYGCKKEIVFDLNDGDNNKLVVEGYISTDEKAHRIKLSRSTNYYVNEAPVGVNGATVYINDGANDYTLTEDAENPGDYYTDSSFAGSAGLTYTLNIKTGSESYDAISTLPRVVLIDSMDAHLDTIKDFWEDEDEEEMYYNIRMSFQEPAGVGDYYMWLLYKNGVLITDSMSEIEVRDDELVDGNYFGLLDYYREEAVPGDVFKIEMLTITKETFDFHIGFLFETEWRGGIFDTPPSNMITNVSDGGFGLFHAAGYSSREVTIK
ncbi:MAG: DUF4249 domain-containing protein [Flavobacteriales bacterium]|nr:DUF4249 domain-containing protein [Flavobacteriales bacterium]